MPEDIKKVLKKTLKKYLDEQDLKELKVENGDKFPKEAYLHVPDTQKSSTWKLRIWETPSLKVTKSQLGVVSTAFSEKGLSDNKIKLSLEESEKIRKALFSLFQKEGVLVNDIPKHLMEGGAVMPEDLEKIKKLEDAAKATAVKNKAEIDALKKEREKAVELAEKNAEKEYKIKLQEIEEKAKKASENENVKLAERLERAEKELAARRVELHKEKVDKRIKYFNDVGIWPAVTDVAKQILLHDDGSFGTIKLQDGKTTVDMGLAESIEKMLTAIPKTSRVSFKENTDHPGSDRDSKYADETEVGEYAKKNNISYEDSCSYFAEQGRLEHI